MKRILSVLLICVLLAGCTTETTPIPTGDSQQGGQAGPGPDMGGANFTGGAAGGADDVVDADYTVVDDDK